MRIGRRETDAAEFVVGRGQRAPLRSRRQGCGRARQPLGERRDQRMLLGAALQLPEPETDEDRQHRERKNAEADTAAPPRRRLVFLGADLCLHFGAHSGARSISRPGAALWWNCSAINSDFIARSGHSVTARVSGSHKAACSQNGG